MSSIGAAPRAAASLSPARAEASRRNGARSRGPKTPEGKARSAQNALKHGLRAQRCVVLPGERASAFAALEAALMEELAPEGALQSVLAQRIVAASWRLARAERLEAELFANNLLAGRGLGHALIRDCNGGTRSFDTLLRYRGGTLAELWRALRTLKALQAEAAAQKAAERAPSVPQRVPDRHEPPFEPESRANPGGSPARAASEPAPRPGANPGGSDGAGGRAVGEAHPAEPAWRFLPVERAERGGLASLLAGTALVPLARRSSP
jgi:hypothetical protein